MRAESEPEDPGSCSADDRPHEGGAAEIDRGRGERLARSFGTRAFDDSVEDEDGEGRPDDVDHDALPLGDGF